ncbi:MAG: cache domain-containing protein [Marinobacterium sp.]|nr:cache domain-containing protein [Marinobacterium sp.]
MRYASKLAMAAGMLFSVSALASGQFGTPEEAHDLVQKAVTYYQANGQEATMAALNDRSGDFVDRDLYVFVHDDKGVYYAIAPKPKFIGRNLSSVRDANGKFIVKEQIEQLKSADSMWQEYHWENPVSRKIQLKKTYCEKVSAPAGELHFCSGAYVQN